MFAVRVSKATTSAFWLSMRAAQDSLATTAGWMLSLILHALSIGTAMVLAAEFSILPREKPFHWEVSLVAASEPEPISSDLPMPIPSASAFRHVTPDVGSPQPNQPETVSQKMITASSPIGAAPSTVPSHDLSRIHSAKRISLRASEAIPEAKHPSDKRLSEPLTTHEEATILSPELTTVFPVTEPIAGETAPPEVDASERSVSASEPSVQEPIRVAHRPIPHDRDPVVSRTLHADYGWLAEMLFTKVEQLKRYPRSAKTHRWEGNVVLQAVVSEDGRVADITVVESSGHSTLDQEAIALLERASPLSLKHPLGQPHVVVQLPIGYRLE